MLKKTKSQKSKRIQRNNIYNDLWKQDVFKEYEECCVQLEAIKTQYKKCLTDFEKWQLKGNRSGHEGELDEHAKAIKKSLDGKEKKKVDGILKKEDLKDLDAKIWKQLSPRFKNSQTRSLTLEFQVSYTVSL